MGLPSDLLQRSAAEGARLVALELLDQAHEAARQRLAGKEDSLHDFRVALRRMRSTLRAWRADLAGSVRGKDRRRLDELQTSTNSGRDAEVGLEWLDGQRAHLASEQHAGLTWIEKRFEKRRDKAGARARARLEHDFERLEGKLRVRLERLQLEVNVAKPKAPELFGAALAQHLREHAQDLDKRFAEIQSPSIREQPHAARIGLKRLRYLAEPVEELVPEAKAFVASCKKLQALLGDLNDSHVLGAELDEALDAFTPAQRTEKPPPARAGLFELALRSEQERGQLFEKLEREWLGAGKTALLEHAEALARAVEKAARKGTEIERKYLLSALPELPRGAEEQELEQGWLPGDVLRERLRRVRDARGTRFFRTLKLGSGVTRTELEEATTSEVFDALWPQTEGARIRKRRYRVAEGERTWEIDAFLDRELFLAEIELDAADEKVDVPAWLAPVLVREVTDEPGFTNFELAREARRPLRMSP